MPNVSFFVSACTIFLISCCTGVSEAFSIIPTTHTHLNYKSCYIFASRTSNNICNGIVTLTAKQSKFSYSRVILRGSSKHGDFHNPQEHGENDDSMKEEDEEEPQLVTRDMLLRDMLSDPEQKEYPTDSDISSDEDVSSSSAAKVKRKKKNGSSQYRTLDNRDSLPFLVKVATPDPYTSNEQMKKEAKLNTERAKKKLKKNGGAAASVEKLRYNLVGMDGRDSISSSIYTRTDDGSMHKIVGEFSLDKSTNCGDIIEIGDGTQYQVQRARCQYKYVGGKRFVMTRKILEVKEIKRILIEKEVQNLFNKELSDINDDGDLGGAADGFVLE